MELQQVHGNSMEPRTWVLATYEDTQPRFVYMCACGKVNAIDASRVSGDGIVVSPEGVPEEVSCEGKTCSEAHELRFLDATEKEMDDRRAAVLIRRASEHALEAGVTAETIAEVVAAAKVAAEKAAKLAATPPA